MGTIITNHDFFAKSQSEIPKLVIYCCPTSDLIAKAISLNNQLAKVLLQYKPNRRAYQVETSLRQVLANIPSNPIIKDFDVLFNPNYNIDILKIMIQICKNRPFAVIWPGTLHGNKLVYAETGYADYKEYNIDDYDIICVCGG